MEEERILVRLPLPQLWWEVELDGHSVTCREEEAEHSQPGPGQLPHQSPHLLIVRHHLRVSQAEADQPHLGHGWAQT